MKKFSYKDIIFISVVLLLGAVFSIIIYLNSNDGHIAVITIAGEHYKTVSLDEDGVYIINALDGYNTVEISENKVRIKDADCPDKICVHTGAINKGGQQIVCLPHKLVVSVEGGDYNDRVDSVSN